MFPVPASTGAAFLIGAAVSALVTIAVVTVWAKVRYGRRLPTSVRCRLGRPAGRWPRRGRRARWCRRRSWATWVDDVLLVRSGVLRLWLTPLPVGVAKEVTVRALGPREVRGLGRRPVALRFTLRGAGDLEIAVASDNVDRLVGPFLTAALAELPHAPRERGG